MLLDKLGLRVEDLVALTRREEGTTIGKVIWVPPSDEPKGLAFFGDFSRSVGERRNKFIEASSGADPSTEIYYRKRDYVGDMMEIEFNAGTASFLRRFQEFGGDTRALQGDYRALFGEDF